MLEVQNVAKSYRLPGQKRISVLEDVSLSVEPGEHVAVIGRSGAGKTTLLNILGGLDRPTSGDVRLDGESLFQGFGAARRRSRIRAAKIGFVFQSFHLMPELDIVENVLLPAMTGAVKVKSPRARAKDLLAKVGLAGRYDHLPAELSGGEQQRVAMARALANNPGLIIADEPTGNLDPMLSLEIMNLLIRINKSKNKTVIVITHEKNLVDYFQQRVVTLSEGRIVDDKTGGMF